MNSYEHNRQCHYAYLASTDKPCWGAITIVDDTYDNQSGECWEIWACQGHADAGFGTLYIEKEGKK